MATIEIRNASTDWLHPVAREQFISLAADLRKAYDDGNVRYDFRIFETYRTPQRQEFVNRKGNSKAQAFRSAHQFGLAVDYVPFEVGRGFFWPDASDAGWNDLRRLASARKLMCDIRWDRNHVEHPMWLAVRQTMLHWRLETASEGGSAA